MLLCYAPVVHWIWGGGMMADGGIFGEVGTKDFAGGIVVHETAGLAALLLAMMLGPRKNRTTPPHNPGYVMIGASCCGSVGSALTAVHNWRQTVVRQWH